MIYKIESGKFHVKVTLIDDNGKTIATIHGTDYSFRDSGEDWEYIMWRGESTVCKILIHKLKDQIQHIRS